MPIAKRVTRAVTAPHRPGCAVGVCDPQRTQGLKASAPRGTYDLVSLEGPGLFLSANVTKQGGPTGLTATGNQLWSQDSAGVMGVAEAGDAFGFDLAAANFGNDPAADLAVGVPTEDLIGSSKVNVGSVNVLYGSSTGVTSTGNQSWTQDSAGIIGIAEVGDRFGLGLGFSSTSPG